MSKLEKPIVLLADDNEATCTLVTAILQRDFAVELASDGAEAIDKLKTKEYAAVLLDIRMPGVDGYAVLDFLAASRPEVLRRVIVLTASLSSREIERVRAHEVCSIIAKPFEVETLLAAVRQCTGSGSGASFITSGVLLLLAEMLRSRLM